VFLLHLIAPLCFFSTSQTTADVFTELPNHKVYVAEENILTGKNA
jgi:hypothetical protein